MNTMALNELKIPCPDGFHALDDEARSRMHFAEEGPGVCLSDPERHMLISVAYKRISGLSAVLLKDRDVAKNMDGSVKKAMQPFGYKADGSVKRMVGGNATEGFCYTYTAQSIAMYGESLVLRYSGKSGKSLYYFHLYAREELKAESIPVWEELLSGAEWI